MEALQNTLDKPGVLDARVTLEPPVAEVAYEQTNPERLARATASAGFPSSVRKLP